MTACSNTKTEQNSESKEVAQTEKKEEKPEEPKDENKKPGLSQTTQVIR